MKHHRRPRLLDLFCGAGGAAVGYHRAGFDVVGVDINNQRHYPFKFYRDDAFEFLLSTAHKFDVVHASPPCQRYSSATFCTKKRDQHHDLLAKTRDLLMSCGRHWVIENVDRAPIASHSAKLCGLMFGLKVLRHRSFEASCLVLAPYHPSHRGVRIGRNGFVCCAGHGGKLTGWSATGTLITVPKDHRTVAAWSSAMGIDWMTRDELALAIPPAYTEFVGSQLLNACVS